MSTVTRLVFSLFLLLGTAVCVIMILPGMETQLNKASIWGIEIIVKSDVTAVYKYVYRICFALACFFFLFCLIMIRVRSSMEPRAHVQNGFWFFKFMILVGITVGAFYIPDGTFNTVWFYFGLVGSFISILIQLIFLINIADTWNKTWKRKCWSAGLHFFTILHYAVAFAAVVLFYLFYTQADDCTEHKVFISLNLIFCVLVSIISILPKVQEAPIQPGLLQSSIVTLYSMCVTWSAMSNNPNRKCNPSLLNLVSNSTTPAPTLAPGEVHWYRWDAQGIVGFIIFLFCACFTR